MNPAAREAPDGWVVIKVIAPNRSWPFGAQNRTFCSWACVATWGEYLDDTNGLGDQVDKSPVDSDAIRRHLERPVARLNDSERR